MVCCNETLCVKIKEYGRRAFGVGNYVYIYMSLCILWVYMKWLLPTTYGASSCGLGIACTAGGGFTVSHRREGGGGGGGGIFFFLTCVCVRKNPFFCIFFC